jgi:hypothetical protein
MIVATFVVAALVLAQAALSANVRVRIEGKTQTIFGAAQPRVTANDALGALEAASMAGEFYYHVTQFSFGPFVDQIGRYRAEGSNGWTFKVNGVSPQLGADKATLRDGDVVLWYWTTFGETGGPPTLLLRRTARNCYAVLAQDDSGRLTPAAGAVLLVDGRRRTTRGGRACVGRHRALVRAVRTGAVRSNALA